MAGSGARIRRLALLGLLLLCAAPPSAAAFPVDPLGHAGRWITDATGRVVILHGLAIVPPGPEVLPDRAGIGADDARFMAANGFDTVRLGLFYAGIEPRLGRFDDSYVDHNLRLRDTLARAGIFTLVDFHQDLFNPRYGGRGLPDWMTFDDGVPNQPRPGYPLGYLVDPAVNRAYDNFFANHRAADGRGVLDHYADGWRRVAGRLRGAPRVLGYDVFNEPWPGSRWATCANTIGCPPGGFDQTTLTRFTRNLLHALRTVDRRHLLWYEPNLQFDLGAATGLGSPDDPDAGFTFHDYCLAASPGLPHLPDQFGLCGIDEQLVMRNAEKHSRATGSALLLSEFGDLPDPVIVGRVADLADEAMISWQHWGWYSSATGNIIRDPKRPPGPGNINAALWDRIVRPFPRAVAGTPLRYRYDRLARTFDLSWLTRLPSGRPASGSMETEVFVPRLHYPTGYAVRAEGARVVSAPGACVVRLRGLAGARQAHVRITAARTEAGTRCEPARARVRAQRNRARTGARVNWSSAGGDLAVWGYDVHVDRVGRLPHGMRRAVLRLRETQRRTLRLRLRRGRCLRVLVRAVDAAGARGRWARTRRLCGPAARSR